MRQLLFLITILMSLGCATKRQGSVSEKAGVRIFLLMGQSNMAGRGVLTPEFEDLKHPRVFMLNANNGWVLAKHPVHFDKPKSAGIGPGLEFGKGIAAAFPKDTIYLVPCAVGGTSISKWEPGAFDKATNTHPYDDALLRIKEALKKGNIDGAIWLQGESDSNPKSALVYLSKLQVLIERVRKETNAPKLPFVAGELGTFRDNYKLINKELQKLPSTVPFTALVTSENLTHKGDTTHFDAKSATMYGSRFSKGMLKLMKR